jgi:hypothetical protein
LKGHGFSRAIRAAKSKRDSQAAEKPGRREAGVVTPHKTNRINAGFSPGEWLGRDFSGDIEFFRSLFSP